MQAPNKHQQKTEAMRYKLLKSARHVFSRHGFEAARIEDIAAQAGHTRGAFYAHFDTKEDLFLALLEQQAFDHLAKLQKLMDACRTLPEQMQALREYYVSRARDKQWSMLMLEFKLFVLRHPRLRKKIVHAHRQIRSMKLQLRLQALPEEATRMALEGSLQGLVLEHAYDNRTVSEQQLTAVLRKIFNAVTLADPS